MAKTTAQTSDHSTEEEENKLPEEEDLDVIDCYTDPMDSDLENADERNRQASACPEQVPDKSPSILVDAGAIPAGDDGLHKVSDEVSSSSESMAPSSNSEMPPSVQTDSEINRMVSEPLVKQLVVPEIDVSDGKDDELSQESLQIEDTGDVGEEVDGSLHICQEEIPDDLQLKLDFSLDVGGMDYATEDIAEPWSEHPEDIYTIDLVSTDEEGEPVSEASETVSGENQNLKILQKCGDTDKIKPSSTKRQKKAYPHKKRSNKVGRSNSKCSAISASTIKSSNPDERAMLENVENKNTAYHSNQETTDIALMLETFISSATSDKNVDLVLHSPSAEEIFSMDSLFATQEQPEPLNSVTGDDHNETLHVAADQISSCADSVSGSAQPEMVNVQVEIVAPATDKQQSTTNSTDDQKFKGQGCSKKEVQDKRTWSGVKEKTVGILPKRGRPKGSKNKKISDRKQESHKKAVSKQSLSTKERKQTTKSALKRKFKELFGNSSSCSSLEQEPKLASSSIELQPKRASEDNGLEKTNATVESKENPRIVLSPLTADKLRGINATSQKPTSVAKACQTEISGLTWSVDFDKLRNLINGAESTAIHGSNELPTESPSSARLSNGVDIPSRSVLQGCLDSPSAPTAQMVDPVPTGGGSSGEVGTNTAEQRSEQQINSVRSSFRIPKRRASTSPQVVTSSTPHLVDKQDGLGANPRALTSRSVDRSRQFERAYNELTPSNSSGIVQRTIGNDNEDIENGNASSRDRQEVTLRMMVQERFQTPANHNVNSGRENARNAHCTPPSSAENGAPGIRQASSNQEPQPAPTSMSLDNRSSLPMVNVTRTINNDVSQPPHEPQSVLSGIRKLIAESNGNAQQINVTPEFGDVPAASYAASSSNVYNRGGIDPGRAGYGMMRMQQQQSRGNPNNINDFFTMLREQFSQRQQLPIQPPVLPSVAPLLIQAGSSQLPAFNQLFPQVGQIAAQSSALRFTEQPSNERMIRYIFGCIDFLKNRCFNTHCPYPHILPNSEDVFQKVSTLNCDAIMNTYRFVAGRDDLFIRYFPVYASVMGRNKMYQQLVNTITDCEKPKRPIRYYECIVEGLKTLGSSPVQAVQLILQKHAKKDFDQINVLVKLILDTVDGIPAFLRTLEEFLHVKGYRYEIMSVNRLLGFCMQSTLPTNDLAAFVCKLILRVPAGEEQFVDVRTLLEFIQKVRLDAALTLDVEDIVKKYGSVAMRP